MKQKIVETKIYYLALFGYLNEYRFCTIRSNYIRDLGIFVGLHLDYQKFSFFTLFHCTQNTFIDA